VSDRCVGMLLINDHPSAETFDFTNNKVNMNEGIKQPLVVRSFGQSTRKHVIFAGGAPKRTVPS